MAYKNQTPEEKENGLVCIGEVYQSITSQESEIYLRVKTESGVMAYLFRNPHNFFLRVAKYADKILPLDCEE